MVTWNVATRHPEEDLAEMLGFGTSGKQKVQERLPDFFAIGWDKLFHGYDNRGQRGKKNFVIYFALYVTFVTVLEGSWLKQAALWTRYSEYWDSHVDGGMSNKFIIVIIK